MATPFQVRFRRVLVILLIVGLAVAAYAGWWLFSTEAP